jgi:hypothetical protein
MRPRNVAFPRTPRPPIGKKSTPKNPIIIEKNANPIFSNTKKTPNLACCAGGKKSKTAKNAEKTR